MSYTVKEVAKKMKISEHTLRFYENKGLFPFIDRNENNVRLFSESDLNWVFTVQCLRSTGMSIADIKKYVDLCLEGDSTIEERYEIIKNQTKIAKQQFEEMQKKIDKLKMKEEYYKKLMKGKTSVDKCNPMKKDGVFIKKKK